MFVCNKNRTVWTTLAASLMLCAGSARAAVKLPAVISDNMLLQADQNDRIWGTAEPGEHVTVSFDGQKLSSRADEKGRWQVTLAPMKADDSGDMTISGSDTVVVHNVLVGTVWICSGQSNMEFGIKMAHNAAEAIPKANDPKLRLFLVTKDSELHVQDDLKGHWEMCTPETVVQGGWNGFSAVAYFFGREIRQEIGEPVGLIDTCWGGTPAEAWTSIEALKSEPSLAEYVEKYQDTVDHLADKITKFKADRLAYPWDQYNKEDAEAKAKVQPPPKHPKPPVDPKHDYWMPSALYNGMIHPLLNYRIQGVIWYQGESNWPKADQYRTLFPTLIKDWRARWGEGDFPFIFVQLASFGRPHPVPTNEPWSHVQEAQLLTLKSLPNTGMAVAVDIGAGENVHPTDKLDVGHRLAVWAEDLVWHKDVVCSGPLYDSMNVEGDSIRITFTHVGDGLMIGAPPAATFGASATQPANRLEGFEIAGADKKFVFADARIDGNTVIVHSKAVNDPVAVRYAWAGVPRGCNLYNRNQLPASPFRTDQWTK